MKVSFLFTGFLVLPLLLGAGRISQFEQKDIVGTTTNISGTVGTSAIAIPTVAGNPIAEALIRMPNQSPNSRRLQISFTSIAGPWITLSPGEFMAWSIKGYKTQFWILGSTAGVEYEIIINREP
jgi:hypothetical protein